MRPATRKAVRSRSFSMLEVMMVIALIMVLATICTPFYMTMVVRARETVLRDDLFTMRAQIDRFTKDNQRAPTGLNELVEKGYLGVIPRDPFTGSADTWTTVQETTPVSMVESAPTGIIDVHSGADGTSLQGSLYASW